MVESRKEGEDKIKLRRGSLSSKGGPPFRHRREALRERSDGWGDKGRVDLMLEDVALELARRRPRYMAGM